VVDHVDRLRAVPGQDIGIFFILLPIALCKTGGVSGLAEKLPADATWLTAIGGEKILTYFVTTPSGC
jgi:hypothetical protein